MKKVRTWDEYTDKHKEIFSRFGYTRADFEKDRAFIVIEVIEEVLMDYFQNDDSHVVDGIVRKIRETIQDENFAKGAAFDDNR